MSYNARIRSLLAHLGITSGRLPVAGMERRDVFGLAVWITPLPPREPGARFKRSTHRLMCECVRCGRTMSAGRLHQHAGTATCARAAERGR